MLFALSSRAVVNSIYAIAALDAWNEPSQSFPLLAPDRIGALKVMVKNQFAALSASLFPLVTDTNLDNETPVADVDTDEGEWLMEMEIPSADGLPSGGGAHLRRTLEMMLAMGVLVSLYSHCGRACNDVRIQYLDMLSDVRHLLGDNSLCQGEIEPFRV